MLLKRLSFNAWVRKFRPIKNRNWPAASDGFLFGLDGEEEEFVLRQDPMVVWTLTITDLPRSTLWSIGNGRLFVNRHGHFVTKRPWTPTAAYYIKY